RQSGRSWALSGAAAESPQTPVIANVPGLRGSSQERVERTRSSLRVRFRSQSGPSLRPFDARGRTKTLGPGTVPAAARLRNHTQSCASGLGGVVHIANWVSLGVEYNHLFMGTSTII